MVVSRSSSQEKEQAPLSERELQIVELVAAGLTNQEISTQLDISKRTVDNHISNVLNKTDTGNRVALVRWALKWGKVCIDDVNCCNLPSASAQSANGQSATGQSANGHQPPGNQVSSQTVNSQELAS